VGVVYAGAPQLNALVNGAYREPTGSLGAKHARNFESAMTVCVCLDHPGDFHIGADYGAHIAEVASDLFTGDKNVRSERSGHLL
jgi:hypothetical protein